MFHGKKKQFEGCNFFKARPKSVYVHSGNLNWGMNYRAISSFLPQVISSVLRAESPINLSHEIKPLFYLISTDRRWFRDFAQFSWGIFCVCCCVFRQVPWLGGFIFLFTCFLSLHLFLYHFKKERKNRKLFFICWYSNLQLIVKVRFVRFETENEVDTETIWKMEFFLKVLIDLVHILHWFSYILTSEEFHFPHYFSIYLAFRF